jgi:predicted ATP-binding protein involved in virulence
LDRQDKRFHSRIQRIASLFVEDAELIPLAAWWPALKSNSRVQLEVQELLKNVVPDELVLSPKLDDSGELLVQFRGVTLPETALSDGYRAFLGWFGDLLYRLTQVQKPGKKLKAIKGIVLVDEIDLHLHPSWQQTVIDRISKTLPALQFIVTTHSPLIVGGVRRESLRVLTIEDGTITIKPPSEETYGRTPDQILLSSSFGLKQVRPDAFIKMLQAERKKCRQGI